MAAIQPSCVDCGLRSCVVKEGEVTFPAFCPTAGFSLGGEPELGELMREEENALLFRSAAHSSHVSFAEKLSRIDEFVLFAQGIGAKKIGIASCISLANEARFAAKYLRGKGFEVVGALCKVGHLTCDETGVPVEARHPNTALCNPIYQAQLLNAEHVDLNAIVGLCVGHDALFIKHAEAPCTMLVAKDHKFDHKTVCALREE